MKGINLSHYSSVTPYNSLHGDIDSQNAPQAPTSQHTKLHLDILNHYLHVKFFLKLCSPKFNFERHYVFLNVLDTRKHHQMLDIPPHLFLNLPRTHVTHISSESGLA